MGHPVILSLFPTERPDEQMLRKCQQHVSLRMEESVFCLGCQYGLQTEAMALSLICLNSCVLKSGISFFYHLLHPRLEAKITENILGIFTDSIDISLALPTATFPKHILGTT